ncbi:MAG TPA: GerMN domain-containing protein, partial [Candidatus Krumholzibacteria bacterium]|nr:GerMN domain-containing protein [Candidatus Krumholzibacteria bacterium]
GGLSSRRLALIGLAAFVAIALVVWWAARPRIAHHEPAPKQVESVPEGTRNVTLYFADTDEPNIHPETRELAVSHREDEQLREVIDALIAGPTASEGLSAIPGGTKLLSAMVDADSGTVYLDFSGELVSNHPGGSAAEYCTIAAIVRTVGDNFPELQRVQLLVDGAQVESIAGHLRADQPFVVKEWR